eukprot:3015367-Amphidinium_carterae.1
MVLWDNRNVTEESKRGMVRTNPQMFREPYALDVNRCQEVLWRSARRDGIPVRSARLVEDYLSKVRCENQRERRRRSLTSPFG